MLIDTHFHLDLMDNMQSLIRELQTADVGVFAVGTTPRAYTKEKQFCFGIENIKIGMGMHPQLVAEEWQALELFQSLAKESTFIGEIGLDFNNYYLSNKDKQLLCFREIANICADEGGKIISIHSVKAARTVIEELNKVEAFEKNICIFHWFTGSAVERKMAIDSKAWFSINPRMLKTKSGQETIKLIPRNKILLETDAPFTMEIKDVATLKAELEKLTAGISEIRGEDMREQIEENSLRIIHGKCC